MNTTVSTTLDEDILSEAEELSLPPAPSPSLRELNEAASYIDPSPRFVIVRREGALIGVAPFRQVKRSYSGIRLTVHEPLGTDHYDYNRLYCSAQMVPHLYRAVHSDALSAGSDSIWIQHLVGPDMGKVVPRMTIRSSTTQIFDCTLAPKGWNELLMRKNIRNQTRKLRRHRNYRVVHSVGSVDSSSSEHLANLHMERWGFDGQASRFANPAVRSMLGIHPQNKVLTTLFYGDDVVAYHHGMLFDDTLLWSTPVINIKYLELSPLIHLLYETIRLCHSLRVTVLDLGLGNEAYKQRVCNKHRKLVEIMIPLTPKGLLAFVPFWLRKTRLIQGFRSQLHKLVSFLRYQNQLPKVTGESNGHRVEDWVSLVDRLRSMGVRPERRHYNWIKAGNEFVFTEDRRLVMAERKCRLESTQP